MNSENHRLRLTPIKELSDEHLLNEFAGIERWAGDDFAVDPVPKSQLRRGRQARDEILRRMAGRNKDVV